jgi:hypothetical protein
MPRTFLVRYDSLEPLSSRCTCGYVLVLRFIELLQNDLKLEEITLGDTVYGSRLRTVR